ncbi:5-formyltetrahydrofolate cyclo-ligase [Gordonia sp. HY285]|uniref:5-formyltetrahydrofolate cyclo-ligase n=1 Tax=Gordonia liuliyuniae TaxID=2911517 RepID=UPI001F0071B1|nr:5-formyltetrahydrofolate cyclo-ligase [Gordonia liuliyuniae]MCF8612192.1 5-formyltetrahydrofolate cyclo-ligase [Gordonia liuliyuniae]
MAAETTPSQSKSELRRAVLDARASMSPFVLAQVNAELAEWMYRLPVDIADGAIVAAYVASGSEPGSTAILDVLVDRGFTVLLPVVPPGDPARLQWGEYRGEMALEARRWGLLEPTGRPLRPDAIHRARLILVPALGADRSGARLGRGAGYYDRTLATIDAPVVAVVNDAEFLDDGIEQSQHDVPVDWVLTPGSGFTAVGV